MDWDDGEATTRPPGSAPPPPPPPPPLNGSWSGHHRLMAALGGVPTSGGPGGRTMLHSLLAMTAADRAGAYPSMAVSPPVKSPSRPASSALKQTTNVAPPYVF